MYFTALKIEEVTMKNNVSTIKKNRMRREKIKSKNIHQDEADNIFH